MRGIGIDIIEVKRFKQFQKKRTHLFLAKNFSQQEIGYCFSFQDTVPHLAGLFAAKEAVVKSLGGAPIALGSVEIRHTKNGAPVAYRNNKKLSGVFLSISHTATLATAIALRS